MTSSGASRSSRSGLRRHAVRRGLRAQAFRDRSGAAGAKQRNTRFTSEVPFINPIEPAIGYRAGSSGLVAVDADRLGKSLCLREPVVIGRGHQRLGHRAGWQHPGQAGGDRRADLQANDAHQRHGRAGDGRLGVHEASRLHGDQGLGTGFQRLSQPLHRSGRSRSASPCSPTSRGSISPPSRATSPMPTSEASAPARSATSSSRRRASGASTRRWRGSSWH